METLKSFSSAIEGNLLLSAMISHQSINCPKQKRNSHANANQWLRVSQSVWTFQRPPPADAAVDQLMHPLLIIPRVPEALQINAFVA